MITHFTILFSCLFLTLTVTAVDRNNFKTCNQATFCKRQRSFNKKNAPSSYKIDANSINIDQNNGVFTTDVINSKNPANIFKLKLENYENDIVRFNIDENSDLFKRLKNDDVIKNENLKSSQLTKVEKNGENSGLVFNIQNDRQVKINFDPILVQFFENGKEYLNFNSRNLLNIEHFRKKDEINNEKTDSEDEENHFSDHFDEEGDDDDDDFDNDSDDLDEVARLEAEEKEQQNQEFEHHNPDDNDIPSTEGQWSENFKSHQDSKPRGPESIGLDVNFIGFKHLYGLPEHADRFWLRDTIKNNLDPYRLYNLDVFEYELDETMALYGSVPWVLAHNKDTTFGVLWLNPSETWVDIEYHEGQKIGGMFSSEKSPEIATSRFMSESGLLDIFIMNGPTPKNTMDQLSIVSGRPVMPALWSLGYHQCRWNYRDMQDVENVDKGFEKYDIPYDVIWLDIEHTDGKRYFTWDKIKFSDPVKMIDNIARTGRKMVTIVDPHIKVDNNYNIFTKIRDAGLLTKDRSGNKDFEGWCWPGNSGYPDFTNKEMQTLWAEYFNYNNYIGSTPNLFTWNDMNEPSVFNGPEITMHKDAIQRGLGDWEHRHVHNLYGLYVHKATYEGQIIRNQNTDKLVDRPFVLSRAFYVGTQTAGAIWTGDNKADWDHMRYSVPMCMSIGISGIPFIGADVGGFFGNPEVELLVRWYQVATTQPFFRAHAHIDSKRREPWLFGEKPMEQIRNAIRFRYRILHYIYSTFHESHISGNAVMRPIFYEFPSDEQFFGTENAWMTGNSLVSFMVDQPNQVVVDVELPGSNINQNWYKFPMQVSNFMEKNIQNEFKMFKSGTKYSVNCEMDVGIPIFIRGGSIILTKERPRRNSELMAYDPYTMYIALNNDLIASGSHYDDNQRSLKSSYITTSFKFDGNSSKLTISTTGDASLDDYKHAIERIVILRPDGNHRVIKKPEGVFTSVNGLFEF